jgi:hypothetical protein
MEDITTNDNFYNCIGVFRVKKKDVEFITDVVGELEVVVNPNKVKLIDYRFLNIIDLLTSYLTRGLIFQTQNISKSGIANIDNFYIEMKKTIRKTIKKYPSFITDFLCMGMSGNEKDTPRVYGKYLEEMRSVFSSVNEKLKSLHAVFHSVDSKGKSLKYELSYKVDGESVAI